MLSLPDPAGVDLTARVLVLTQAEDPTADLVLEELNRRSVRFFRCDPGDFPTKVQLTAHHDPDGDRWHGWIHDHTRGTRLEQVRAPTTDARPGFASLPACRNRNGASPSTPPDMDSAGCSPRCGTYVGSMIRPRWPTLASNRSSTRSPPTAAYGCRAR